MQIFTLPDFILFLLSIFFCIKDENIIPDIKKLYLSSLKYIRTGRWAGRLVVVICFQNCILVH